MAPLSSRVLMMKNQSAALQLSCAPINGEENLKKPELVSSPTDLSTEEEKSTDFGTLVVCLPDSKAFAATYAPKEPCFPDKDALGIQPSLDELTTTLKKKRLPADNAVRKRKEENDVGEERAAVEHDEEDESYLCVKAWKLGEALKVKDDLLPSKQNFVDHVSLLSVNCRESSPIQESESSDSDAIDEQGPPSVILIDSSEEVAPGEIEEECDFQEVANAKVDKKSIKKPPRKRHMSGKRKRNVYLVVCDSPPVKKQLNRTPRYQPKRKKAKLVSKPSTEEDIDSLIAEFCESAVVSGLNTHTAAMHHKAGMRRSSPRVSYNTPRDSADSGLESGSFGSDEKSSSNGSSGGSGSNTGGGSTSGGGGGNSGGGSSGGGDDQGNGEESREKDEDSVMVIDDSSGDEEEDSEESNSAEAMEEDCVKHVASACGLDVFDFDGTDLQHACYCKPGKLCRNINCNKVKDALKHIQIHQTCKCFVQTYKVIKGHAATCKIPGCCVPHCTDIREGKVIPEPVTPPGVAQLGGNQQYHIPPAQYSTRPSERAVDGKIIYNNPDLNFGTHFQEHIDYHVQRNKNELGKGSNGKIFRIITRYPRRRLVVKETAYAILKEEIKVYETLKSHPNIVQHYGVAYKGNEGKASIFMEECGPSLFDFIIARGRRLDPKLAMHYWSQVLDAVLYMHNLQLIHKDIKAKNVLLVNENARAKLADFDSARTLQDELTKAGLPPMGTQGFVSPEVQNRKCHGTPADIYSMGCFLVELIVGVPKFAIFPQQVEQLRLIDEDLADLVVACTNPLPQERPTAMQIKQSAAVKKYQTAAM